MLLTVCVVESVIVPLPSFSHAAAIAGDRVLEAGAKGGAGNGEARSRSTSVALITLSVGRDGAAGRLRRPDVAVAVLVAMPS